jgi:hypothetical protein
MIVPLFHFLIGPVRRTGELQVTCQCFVKTGPTKSSILVSTESRRVV